jgi:hypothetical protein
MHLRHHRALALFYPLFFRLAGSHRDLNPFVLIPWREERRNIRACFESKQAAAGPAVASQFSLRWT